MSTLDIKKIEKVYLFGTIFTIIFSIIYELFSHQVYSVFMIVAFLFPLIGYIIIKILGTKLSKLSINILNCSVVTITLYSILKGVLDIYGTTNSLINNLLFLFIILIVIFIISIFKR